MLRLASFCCALALFCAIGGCERVDAAPTPAATLNFPIALALSRPVVAGDPSPYLVVGNADFDVRYAQGSLQSFDLDEIARRVAACAPEDRPCEHIELAQADSTVPGSTPLLVDEVLVGPHLSDIVVGTRGDRLYVPSRSELNLTWVDFDAATGHFACEGSGVPVRCADRRRTTRVASSCGRTPTIAGDPIAAVAAPISMLTGDPADADRDYLMLAHRGGFATLFLEEDVGGGVIEPVLVHRLDSLPWDLSNATLDPHSGVMWTNGATVNAARRVRELTQIGIDYDAANPECSASFIATRVFISGVDDGLDTRDIVFGPDPRFVHVLSRRPEAILTFDLQGLPLTAFDAPLRVVDPVGFGPSRMTYAALGARNVLAASCFDGRNVWLIDADEHRPLAIVPGFSGPFELVFDAARQLLVVADFRDSVLRVVDLSPLDVGGSPEVAISIGVVRPVSVLR